MSELPVREMTLYKHGIGFFRREGEVEGDEVTLTFRHDAINDVLKSLVVVDQGEGHVRGIRYQTPLDADAAQADSSIRLSDHASLRDLLRDLRGRHVELRVDGETVTGRMAGIDLFDVEQAPLDSTLVSIVREPGNEVATYRLSDVRSLRLLDARAEHDLHFFLDTSLSEDLSRTVAVRLSEGSHRLVVYYVAPSPTWRVSYRLVAETDEQSDTGTALLQGWGLFDNRFDEDLEDVRVTLVAGQPISFIYDLYSSRIPERPVIEEQARVAPGPVEFRAERRLAKRPPIQAMYAGYAAASAREMPAPMPAAGLDREEAAVQPVAEGQEAGAFFEYRVTTPVSVKRGESALVPIISADIAYTRELLYNGAKLPSHPVVALRFANTTGLTLERGPVTIVEDGEYRGEAVIPFTKSGSEVYLAYAVELGVRVVERSARHTEMAGLVIREGYLLINEYQVQTTTYMLENDTDQDHVITIEAPVTSQYELFDTPPPDAETATERRWRVEVGARGEAIFTRRERRLTSRHEQISDLDYRRLERYLRDRWLDQATFDALSTLLDNLAFIEQAKQEQDKLKAERGEVYEREAQLRENLHALKPTGQEGHLRARVLQQLTASEDRLDAIDTRVDELTRQIEQAEARIKEILTELEQKAGG